MSQSTEHPVVPAPPLWRRIVRRLIRWTARIAAAIVLIVVTIVLVRAFDSRNLPELQPWHVIDLEYEFDADEFDGVLTFDAWMVRENRLFDELDRLVYQDAAEAPYQLARYVRGSLCDPAQFERNWNRTTELIPDEIRGGVLLLHGLTDSPYSMRTLAELFYAQGYYVLCPRMPGHGTIPGGLLDVTVADWMEVARMAARRVRDRAGEDGEFIIGGYSKGGALALNYTLDALDDDTLPLADRLLLFSPAVGVSGFAVFSSWHRSLSWMPYFEKYKWLGIAPEFDPFKYGSFPKNAGRQMYLLTRVAQRKLDRLSEAGRLDQLPPILTFQSVVDTTVDTGALVDRLYNRLEAGGHELVLFDINRSAQLQAFVRHNFRVDPAALERRADLPYALTVITNISADSLEVVARTRLPGQADSSTVTLAIAWPDAVYSLSHVAIPFPLDDPIYGSTDDSLLPLGKMEARGERKLLRIPADDLLRLRHNPFFAYIEQRIHRKIAPVVGKE